MMVVHFAHCYFHVIYLEVNGSNIGVVVSQVYQVQLYLRTVFSVLLKISLTSKETKLLHLYNCFFHLSRKEKRGGIGQTSLRKFSSSTYIQQVQYFLSIDFDGATIY